MAPDLRQSRDTPGVWFLGEVDAADPAHRGALKVDDGPRCRTPVHVGAASSGREKRSSRTRRLSLLR